MIITTMASRFIIRYDWIFFCSVPKSSLSVFYFYFNIAPVLCRFIEHSNLGFFHQVNLLSIQQN